MSTATELRFTASASSGEVSALLERPQDARSLLVFGHGAGAGMRHRWMEAAASALATRGVASLRYQFPYVERKEHRPDPQPILLATVRSAVAAAGELAGDLPVFAGGKSMGGRMTSLAASKEALGAVRGLVFFGFPLHPAGAPSTERAEHLDRVAVPMLFLAGTRDKLSEMELLRPVIGRLGAGATLHVIEGADHSFEVLKRSGRTAEEVMDELAATAAAWMESRGGAARSVEE